MANSKASQHYGDPTHTGLVFLSSQTVIFLLHLPQVPSTDQEGPACSPCYHALLPGPGRASMSEPARRWLPQLEAEGRGAGGVREGQDSMRHCFPVTWLQGGCDTPLSLSIADKYFMRM